MNYYYNPPKNSKAAKALDGGSLLGTAAGLYGKLVTNWGIGGIKGLRDQRKQIEALEAAIKKKKQGGKSITINLDALKERLRKNARKLGYVERESGKAPKRTSAHVKGESVGGCAACRRHFERINSSKNVFPESFLEDQMKMMNLGMTGRKAPRKTATNVKGGKVTGRDVLDFFAGPIGWAFMGVRKKREKQIANLQKELASLQGKGTIAFAPEGYVTPQIAQMMALDEFNKRHE